MYSNIFNPKTMKYIKLNTKKGKQILKKYINMRGGYPYYKIPGCSDDGDFLNNEGFKKYKRQKQYCPRKEGSEFGLDTFLWHPNSCTEIPPPDLNELRTNPKKLNVRYIKKNITVINIARNKLVKVCFFVFFVSTFSHDKTGAIPIISIAGIIIGIIVELK